MEGGSLTEYERFLQKDECKEKKNTCKQFEEVSILTMWEKFLKKLILLYVSSSPHLSYPFRNMKLTITWSRTEFFKQFSHHPVFPIY